MNKTLSFIGSAVLMGMAVMLASCSESNDSVTGSATESANNKISFNTVANNPGATRATATTTANFLSRITDFQVWGYFNGTDNYYVGTEGNGIFIDGDGQGKWNYRTATQQYFWPTNALNFYAVTPSTNANYALNGTQLTYTVPTSNTQQIDLMTAHANNQTKSTNNGVVSLNFGHKLSQVLFNAKLASTTISVEIQGITIHNAKNAVTVDLKTDVSTLGTTSSNYAVGLASPVTVNSTTAVSVTDADGVLLLVPQTFAAWTDNTNINQADIAGQGYLEITAKIKSGDTYLLGSDSEYGKTYVSFPQTWKAGSKYTYTLIFGDSKSPDGGGGKDDGGDPILTPITFDVSVTDWSDTTADINM